MTRSFCCKNLDSAMGEISPGKIRTNSVASSKVKTPSIIDAAQEFFRDRAARLHAS